MTTNPTNPDGSPTQTTDTTGMPIDAMIREIEHNPHFPLRELRLKTLIRIINLDWSDRGHISVHAIPYIQFLLECPDDMTMSTQVGYGGDTAGFTVAYLLNNARGWRGDVARRVKSELLRRSRDQLN